MSDIRHYYYLVKFLIPDFIIWIIASNPLSIRANKKYKKKNEYTNHDIMSLK